MQRSDFDRRALAEAIVRVLSGESIEDVTKDAPKLEAEKHSIEWAVRALKESKPEASVDEVDRMLHAGHWSHVRRRRHAGDGGRAADY